nr:hypothetical protein [Desulforamulus profundi]
MVTGQAVRRIKKHQREYPKGDNFCARILEMPPLAADSFETVPHHNTSQQFPVFDLFFGH